MKHKRMLSLLTAALTGISAASVPVILQESACLTASAAAGDWHEDWYNGDIYYGYYEGSNEAVILKCYGEFRTPGNDLTLPSEINGMPVTTIASLAFNAQKFRSVTLPETVKVIEPRAFEACTIKSISLPESLESIGAYAFSRSWLESVRVPAGIKVIEESTFAGCDRMTSVTLEGAELIKVNAFLNCNSITSLTIPDNCEADGHNMAFSDCKNLEFINGYQAVTEETDENGISYPVLDPHIYNVVNKHFSRCYNVKFIDDYCTKLCKYVVKTETSFDPDLEVQTNDWMNDALKARQLHDWLVRHCTYDYDYVDSRYDLRHYIYSSFFLSFGTSAAGSQFDDKMGSTVCEGYSKAYTMLLSACGLESYVVSDENANGHTFNVVKANFGGSDHYYETDVTWDDCTASYDYFLKSDADMYQAHGGSYPFEKLLDVSDEHSLLNQYYGSYSFLKDQCVQSLTDANGDGILDYDFDLDGYDFSRDFANDLNAYQGFLMFAYGVNKTAEQINDRLGDALTSLNALHKGYWDYVNSCAPVSTTAANGEIAEFKVTVFGDNLTYQWYALNDSTGSWEPIQSAEGTGPVLHVEASAATANKKYMCYIWNQDGYYLYSNPVTLTVN